MGSDGSDSSVGMPQDLHIVRKKDEKEPGQKKKKEIIKDFDIEQWQNEEHKGLLFSLEISPKRFNYYFFE